MTAQTQPEVAALLAPWPGPYGGLPPLAGVSPGAIEEAMRASIDMKRAEVQAIASSTVPPTFENTAEALEASGAELRRRRKMPSRHSCETKVVTSQSML